MKWAYLPDSGFSVLVHLAGMARGACLRSQRSGFPATRVTGRSNFTTTIARATSSKLQIKAHDMGGSSMRCGPIVPALFESCPRWRIFGTNRTGSTGSKLTRAGGSRGDVPHYTA